MPGTPRPCLPFARSVMLMIGNCLAAKLVTWVQPFVTWKCCVIIWTWCWIAKRHLLGRSLLMGAAHFTMRAFERSVVPQFWVPRPNLPCRSWTKPCRHAQIRSNHCLNVCEWARVRMKQKFVHCEQLLGQRVCMVAWRWKFPVPPFHSFTHVGSPWTTGWRFWC